MSISSVPGCMQWCLGLNIFLWTSTFCNELPLHTIGLYFIVISGATMSPQWHKKILIRAVDEKQLSYLIVVALVS